MKVIIIFMFLTIFNFAYASANEKKTIAVLEIEPKGEVATEIAEFVTERLRIELFKRGNFRIVERAEIKKVLEEQKLQLAYSEDREYISRVGKLFSADFLLFGSISYIDEKYYLNIKVVDVATSEMIFGETKLANSVSELSSVVEETCDEISGKDGQRVILPSERIFDEKVLQELNKMADSVLKYTYKVLNKEITFPEIENGAELEKRVKEKEREKKDERKEKKGFFKFGGGLLVKYHFGNLNFNFSEGEFSISYPLHYGTKFIFGFGDFFALSITGNICADRYVDETSKNEVFREAFFGFLYGGAGIELHYLLWNFLRLNFNTILGKGSVFYYISQYENYSESNWKEVSNFYPEFYFFEPGVMVAFRILDAFEIGFTASYFMPFHMTRDVVKLEAYTAGVSIIFGF